MVSDWTNSGYTQCRKDRKALSDILIERGQRIIELKDIVQQAQAMTARDRLRISQQGARIAELEAENQALREFVAADDDLSEAYEQYALTGGEPSTGVDEAVARKHAARQRLATEHGLPLPEVERSDG